MSARDRRLAALRGLIAETSPDAARALAAAGSALLIDIRDDDETAAGSPAGALRLGRSFLELRIEQAAPDLDRPLLVLCAGGTRSLFAAQDLRELGYRDVRSVAGGFAAWKAAGLPVETPLRLTQTQRERYRRHLDLPEVGAAGQERLMRGRAVLIGAGGLGSPIAYYLAAAGVGHLTLIDDDVVERSNLQRQILHAEDRIGTAKVASAAATLRAFNPSVAVTERRERLTAANAEALLSGHDLVIDGSDSLATRYLVSDACIRLGLPHLYGAVFRFEGQVSVFWPARPGRRGPCYRCLFPEAAPPEYAPSCAEAGVLGVLPGTIGLLMATEAVKLLIGIGDPLIGRLLHYDALRAETFEVAIDPDPACPACSGNLPILSDRATVCLM
jgi:molybdopterin/thiamine biosynthesis adenylyltransferase/rhodanese-related sulfurtransferase